MSVPPPLPPNYTNSINAKQSEVGNINVVPSAFKFQAPPSTADGHYLPTAPALTSSNSSNSILNHTSPLPVPLQVAQGPAKPLKNAYAAVPTSGAYDRKKPPSLPSKKKKQNNQDANSSPSPSPVQRGNGDDEEVIAIALPPPPPPPGFGRLPPPISASVFVPPSANRTAMLPSASSSLSIPANAQSLYPQRRISASHHYPQIPQITVVPPPPNRAPPRRPDQPSGPPKPARPAFKPDITQFMGLLNRPRQAHRISMDDSHIPNANAPLHRNSMARSSVIGQNGSISAIHSPRRQTFGRRGSESDASTSYNLPPPPPPPPPPME